MLQNTTQIASTVPDWTQIDILVLIGVLIGLIGLILTGIKHWKERQRFSVEIMQSERHTHRLWIKIKIINEGSKNTTVEAPTLTVFDNDREIEGKYENKGWRGGFVKIFPLRMDKDDIKDEIALQYDFGIELPNNKLNCRLNTKYAQNRKRGFNTDFVSRYIENTDNHRSIAIGKFL